MELTPVEPTTDRSSGSFHLNVNGVQIAASKGRRNKTIPGKLLLSPLILWRVDCPDSSLRITISTSNRSSYSAVHGPIYGPFNVFSVHGMIFKNKEINCYHTDSTSRDFFCCQIVPRNRSPDDSSRYSVALVRCSTTIQYLDNKIICQQVVIYIFLIFWNCRRLPPSDPFSDSLVVQPEIIKLIVFINLFRN